MARLAVIVADTEGARLRGFLGRTEIGEDEHLLFEKTRMLHTFGMRTHVDIVFLDKAYRIVRLYENIGPWRICGSLHAHHAVELAPNSAKRKGLALGDVLALERQDVIVR